MNLSFAYIAFLHTFRVLWIMMRPALLLPGFAMAWFMLHRTTDAQPVARHTDPLMTTDASLDFSVVIPFYNPGDSMRPTVERLVRILRKRSVSFEVIAVSDGSTDGSEKSLDGLGPEVRVIVSPQNMGKGAALHRGFAQARGEHIGFVDADGDIDPKHLADYLETAQSGGHEVVYASKRHADSISASSSFRKVVSLGFIALVKTLFAMPVADTQTGCKVFHRGAIARTLPQLREQRFAFDLEFFVAARAVGVRDMVAAPVELKERLAGSSVSHSAVLRTLVDALKVFGRLHLHRSYTPATSASDPTPSAPMAAVLQFPSPARATSTMTIPTQSIPELKAA